jgi:hypothetical protein
MPIPAFDRFGLLPDGIHECTIKEVEVDLAWTDGRTPPVNSSAAGVHQRGADAKVHPDATSGS